MRYFFWVLLILLIVFRYFSSIPVYENGDKVRITTQVLSDPTVFGNYQTFTALGLKVYLPLYPEIYYGDKVVLEGVVEINEKGKKLKNAKLVSIETFSLFGSGVRKELTDFYQESLPQPMSGLVAGIVLGSKRSLSGDFWQMTKDTGVAHVVVASGTNVTFVVAFIFSVTAIYFSRRKSIPIVILSIILYLYISGFEAPLTRAAIMATVTFLVQTSGRLINAWRILFLTAGIMLAIEPFWLTDIGFILSFASTASIMAFAQKFSKLLKKLPKIIREDFSTTLSAQIGVAPILFVTFGQFNLLSPIINVLILWTVPVIMILGSLGGILGMVFPVLGKLILYICYPLLWWFVRVVELFA